MAATGGGNQANGYDGRRPRTRSRPPGWDADGAAGRKGCDSSPRKDPKDASAEAVPKKSAPDPTKVELADAAVVTGGSAAVVRGDDGVTKSPSLIKLAICGLRFGSQQHKPPGSIRRGCVTGIITESAVLPPPLPEAEKGLPRLGEVP